jgi:UDP-glucose 4-epimerase/UDP-glucuronate decarboxylase
MGKLYGEIAMSAACQELGAKGVIVRYHNVFGPDMGPGHFVSDFIDRVLRNEYSIQGGSSTRSFLYISEAIAATLLASAHVSSTPEIYNVGSEEELKILDAAKIILQRMGLDDNRISSVPEPIGSVYRRCPDISKIQEDMQWQPAISFEKGIDSYLEAMNYQRT